MISPAAVAIFIIPAVGMCFAAGLFFFTAVVDKRALRRADLLERKAGA